MDRNNKYNFPHYQNLDEDDSPPNSQIPPNFPYSQFNIPPQFYPPNFPLNNQYSQNFQGYGNMMNYPNFTSNPPNFSNFSDNPPNIPNFTTNLPNFLQNASPQFGFPTPGSTSKPSGSSRRREQRSPSSVPETQFTDRESPISIDSMKQASANAVGKSKKEAWKDEEDVRLAHAFCTISDDPIIGNNQNEGAFWKRIAAYYNEHKPDHFPTRLPTICSSHWHYVKPFVQKFNACYIVVNSMYRSGCSSEDIYKKAMAKFKEESGKKFGHSHVWEIVKDRPAFQSQSDDNYIGTKKTRTSESGASNTSSTQDISVDFDLNEEIRPIGQKAAKRKAKKKTQATTSGNDGHGNADKIRYNFEALNKTLEDMKSIKNTEVELQMARLAAKEAELKENEARRKSKEEGRQMKMFEILQKDTSNMTPEQRYFHEKHCEEIMAKLKSSF